MEGRLHRPVIILCIIIVQETLADAASTGPSIVLNDELLEDRYWRLGGVLDPLGLA